MGSTGGEESGETMTTETTTPTPTLTPEQIDRLEGMELNAAVATWLFGWRWYEGLIVDEFSKYRNTTSTLFLPPTLYVGTHWENFYELTPIDAPENPSEGKFFDVPKYITNPAAADLVEQELQRMGVRYELKFMPPDPATDYPGEHLCVWRIRPWAKNWVGSVQSAPTLKIALCRAALKAAMMLAGEKEEG